MVKVKPGAKVITIEPAQNLNREFIDHLRKFPECLKGRLSECEEWFNHHVFIES